ncbi:PREDICTED: uncharacterized protein LOC108617551 isoform X2 [Drosophila arizonae]|uniref:Uncharacterized protein LOC108617551 isoform X2 n=1 Tax=Drosophila arizonae TaxID=7263 RepID=A0ABM1PNS2_DROAR|nr:PREDICTED: uncharacterized protein LOC108617551 isoform X2 [Drosophila arizonae]
MPASSGLYRIKHGRVLGGLQRASALIFIAYIAACSTCGNIAAVAATTATAPTTPTEPTTMELAPAHSATPGGPSEELQRHINQNLIMSPELELGSSFAAASAAALTAPHPVSSAAAAAASASASPFSPSSSSTTSGSSITSFDSNSLIDDKRLPQSTHQHQHQLQQQQQQLQQWTTSTTLFAGRQLCRVAAIWAGVPFLCLCFSFSVLAFFFLYFLFFSGCQLSRNWHMDISNFSMSASRKIK